MYLLKCKMKNCGSLCTSQFLIIVTPINHSAEDKLVYESYMQPDYISVHGFSVWNSVPICLDGFESTDSCAKCLRDIWEEC